ncbi:Probable N-acetylglucosaminyl-phosphatidylinositol de-N-acetylase (Phosphatidylinositol-glycan biosynthesis class L protein) (PIG-L) [Durusdinium trenchii]|uniref:N-acetylglucosaminylphosphatidylinositol deacetylase n=1 Tax=Durusdinium trenchii TaxID=1381693 RepID=A0ABP0MCJ5_9DINO
MVKTKKSRAAVTHRSADSKGLPPGWIRVESRSKPGAYFYAHPATKRTQTEHPSERNSHRDMTHISSKRPAGPRRRKTDEGVSPMDVEDFEDPAEKAERLRQEAEEAEAAEAARQEMVRQQRAAKRALLKEAEDKRDEGGSEEEKELVSKEELQKWKEDEERREQEEAEAERRRKEEEERKKREEEEAERRQIEEQERRRKEAEEEERRIEAEKIALWKARTAMARKEAEFEMAMSREKQKKEESDKIQLEAERVRQALLERKKQEAEEETKKAEAELRRKAEAERLRREADAKNQKNQRILEPSDQIDVPCFDVFKGGDRIGRFRLSPPQMTWTIGRCPPVDIRASHETVSRKHAQVNRQGCFTFIQDLGSAHGTVLNGHKHLTLLQEEVAPKKEPEMEQIYEAAPAVEFEAETRFGLQSQWGSGSSNEEELKPRAATEVAAGVVLVVAHPDDEAMFFWPTLSQLRAAGVNISVLCLSTGNFDGLGDVRRQEMERSCLQLGVSGDALEILDVPELQDGWHKWSPDAVAAKALTFLARRKATVVLTFDGQGVSGHPNHISASEGMLEAWQRAQDTKSPQFELLMLRTASRQRIGLIVAFG